MGGSRWPMPEADIKQRVINAIIALYKYDSELLQLDTSERSITHKLAEHLQREFSEWNVDCEYNRCGSNVKKLRAIFGDEPIQPDDTEAKTVFPDVIVHRRGIQRNLVVIEVKKKQSRVNYEKDIKKLKAFTEEEYQYCMGLFLVVGKRNERATLRVFAEGVERDTWIDELNGKLEALGYGE